MLPGVASRHRWTSEAAVPRIAAISLTVSAVLTLWAPWITAGAVEERSSKTAFWAIPLGITIAVLTLSSAALMALSPPKRQVPPWTIYLTGGLAILPGALLIGTVEFAQSLVPTSLTPVLTNSDFLILRAEYGAWAHVGLVLGGVTLWSLSGSMSRGQHLVSPARASGRMLLLIAVIAIPIIRALPLFRVDVSSQAVGSGRRTLAAVEIVPGEVPILGVVSTLSVLAFAGLAMFAVVRPHHLTLIGASMGLGTHLAIIWLQVTIASIANSVLPDSWLELIGDWTAIEISTLQTSTLTIFASAVGFAAILLLARGQSEISSSDHGAIAGAYTNQLHRLPATPGEAEVLP